MIGCDNDSHSFQGAHSCVGSLPVRQCVVGIIGRFYEWTIAYACKQHSTIHAASIYVKRVLFMAAGSVACLFGVVSLVSLAPAFVCAPRDPPGVVGGCC